MTARRGPARYPGELFGAGFTRYPGDTFSACSAKYAEDSSSTGPLKLLKPKLFTKLPRTVARVWGAHACRLAGRMRVVLVRATPR